MHRKAILGYFSGNFFKPETRANYGSSGRDQYGYIYLDGLCLRFCLDANRGLLLRFGVKWTYGLLHGETYRLLTPIFVHIGFLHSLLIIWRFG